MIIISLPQLRTEDKRIAKRRLKVDLISDTLNKVVLFNPSTRDRLWTSGCDVYRRQMLSSEVDPRTEIITHL